MTASTHHALRRLLDEGLVAADDVHWGDDAPLHRASPDAEAAEGSLAWVSAKGLKARPERLAAFAGSLLVAPQDADASSVPPGVSVARCARPKLAFSVVASALFEADCLPGWPATGDASPLGDAQLGTNVFLAHGVVLGAGVVIGDNVRIGPNTCIARCTIGSGVEIGANCSIGMAGYGYDRAEDGTLFRFPHLGDVVIEADVSIGSNVCIDRGALGSTRIGQGSKIDNLVHVAHNVVVGHGALLIAHAMIGGSTKIGDRAWIAPTAALINQISVGDDAVVGMGAVVVKNVENGAVVVGNPARPIPQRTA